MMSKTMQETELTKHLAGLSESERETWISGYKAAGAVLDAGIPGPPQNGRKLRFYLNQFLDREHAEAPTLLLWEAWDKIVIRGKEHLHLSDGRPIGAQLAYAALATTKTLLDHGRDHDLFKYRIEAIGSLAFCAAKNFFPCEADFREAVAAEIIRARDKFPDPEHLLFALLEEVHELIEEVAAPTLALRKEAVQVICVAIRLLEEGDPTLPKKGDKQ